MRISCYLTISLALVLLLTCASAVHADSILTLPSGLEIIEEEAFYGDTSLGQVTLPQGLLEIRARAFANSSLTAVTLPDSLIYIADDAFDGPEKVQITVNPDTYAYSWAAPLGYLMDAPVQSSSKGLKNQIEVKWGKLDDAASYNVYYGTSDSFSEATEITGITDTTCTIDGLLSGTVYYTWVKAVNGIRISVPSNTESVITYPDPPAVSSTAVSGNSITLNWDAVTGADVYRVYYNTANDFNTAEHSAGLQDTVYTIEDLEYNKIYYIWIASVNTSGGQALKSPKIISTEPDPFAPVQNTSIGARNKITVSWEAVSGATGYNIYYSTSDDISEATEITGIANTTYVIEDLLSGTIYYTWVKAVGADEVSDASNMKSVITYPDVPSLDTPVVSGNSITLSWNEVTGADYYRIYYSLTNDVNEATVISNIQATEYTLEDLEYGIDYYFWISSRNSSGGLRTANPKTAMTDFDPSAPVQNASEGKKNAVTVNWTTFENAASYNVYYGVTANLSAATEITGIEGTSCTIDNLLSGTVYYTWVKAVLADGITPASNRKSVITWPAAPTLKTLSATGNSLSMTWDEVVGATIYRIRYSANDDYNSATLIDNIRTTAYTIENLEYGTEYSIWITAANTSGTQRTKYKKFTWPDVPTMNDPQVSGNSVTLSWNAVTGATIYRLYYSEYEQYSSSTAVKIDNITDTAYTIENLEYDRTYYLWIAAVNTGGGQRVSAGSFTTDSVPEE